jgi:hypothetical protein
MFGPQSDDRPSPSTTLTPGPNHSNVFQPGKHRQPPTSIKQAGALAHQLSLPYFMWNGRLYVTVTAHLHLATDLTEADIARLPPAPGSPGYGELGK